MPAQLPVLVMVSAYSRWLTAMLIPPATGATCSPAGGHCCSASSAFRAPWPFGRWGEVFGDDVVAVAPAV